MKGRVSSGARRVVSFAARRKVASSWLKVASVAALRVAGTLALSLGISAGAVRLHSALTSGSLFAVKAIRFEGLSHATEADLLARSGLKTGANLFRADLAKAARGIALHPWVASARLSRTLPGEIVVRVQEHEAQALVELGALYAADGNGRLFKRTTRADALDLPIFTGLKRDDWKTQRAEAQRGLQLALALQAEWQRQAMPRALLSEVRIDKDGGLTLFAQADGLLEVRVGSERFAERLQRLSQMRTALSRRNEKATRVQLDLVKAGGKSWAVAQVTAAD